MDNAYLNAVYLHQPKYNQTAWYMFDTDVFDDEWQAFMVYMRKISTAALKKRTRLERLRMMEKSQETNPIKKKVATLATAVSEPAARYSFGGSSGSDNKEERYKAKFEEIKKKVGK